MEEDKSFIKFMQRGQYILQTGRWSDVRFLVGTTTKNQRFFDAHQLILAMASPVFDRMFYGHFLNSDDSIVISDIKPDTFQAMLDYIYTDRFIIDSDDKACELLYTAKKYMLPHVVEQCTHFLWTNLKANNACRIFEIAKLFDEQPLMECSMELITAQTSKIIVDPSFLDIKITTLLAILDENCLNIDSELDLFNCLLKFSKVQGELANGDDNNRAGTSSSMTKIVDEGDVIDKLAFLMDTHCINEDMLRQAVQKIRFLTMTPQQFAEGPARSKLLLGNESLAILIKMSSGIQNDYPMPEGFCQSRILRNSFNSHSVYLNSSTRFSALRQRQQPLMPFDIYTSPWGSASVHQLNNLQFMNCGVEDIVISTLTNTPMTRLYCLRNFTQQIEYLIQSATYCSCIFRTDTNIWILGVQIRTQTFGGFSHTRQFYTESIIVHFQNMDNPLLPFTHFSALVSYDSLLDITFKRPIYVQRNVICHIAVVFAEVGWYKMNSYEREISCNGVNFTFSDGDRDGLINGIIFSKLNNMIE